MEPKEPLNLDADASHVQRDPGKPTVLLVTDSAGIHSGFAQVVRNVFRRLYDRGKWNIIQYGWWHTNPVESVPWDIVLTERDPKNPHAVNMDDRYGQLSFERCASSLRPDIVWTMGDPWMIGPALMNSYRPNYRAIAYMPVDGAPLAHTWDTISHADVVVPYLPWGKEMMERWVPDAMDKVADPIPHGVDTKLYKPFDEAVRQQLRQANGTGPDDILMLSVSRNQARKNLPALIELTYYIRSGDYQVCEGCGRAYRNPYNYRGGQPTGEKAVCRDPACWIRGSATIGECKMPPVMKPGTPHPNFIYYMHTPIIDLEAQSWKLLDVLDTFGLGRPAEDDPDDTRYPGFRWSEHVRVVHGVPEEELAMLYSAADIFALPTTGEGFGLPILEAMSCGTPVVVPNVSSHPNFVEGGGGMLVDIGYNICETMSQYWRGYPDLDDYLTKLLLLVEDRDLRVSLGRAGRANALNYDWDKIADMWEELIDSQLSDYAPVKPWQRVTLV
jgi:glycosyltransferase involved in cell wall biosynthesis